MTRREAVSCHETEPLRLELNCRAEEYPRHAEICNGVAPNRFAMEYHGADLHWNSADMHLNRTETEILLQEEKL